MTDFDDNRLPPQQDPIDAAASEAKPQAESEPPAALPLTGDPFSIAVPEHPFAYSIPPAIQFQRALPEDLRIGWSWVHLLVFLLFAMISQLVAGFAAVAYFSADKHLSQRQLRHLVESDPKFLFTITILWAALVLLFLYVTISVLKGLPFWRSLGWKKLRSDRLRPKGRPWMYFLAGCGLSIFVALAGSNIKNAEHVPIQEFLKNRNGAILLMSMAVLFAPLFEETLFRGYLYPVLARIFSVMGQFLGLESSSAIRAGIGASVVITGTLFGLMHGAQLGWTWGLVSLLTLVGVIFTFARAWTGTVLTSFLLHLGYNSMIALTAIIQTHGFTQFPMGR
jgi:membrane protease YdiL (CAAX protease family)